MDGKKPVHGMGSIEKGLTHSEVLVPWIPQQSSLGA
jgi:hypothetical protein